MKHFRKNVAKIIATTFILFLVSNQVSPLIVFANEENIQENQENVDESSTTETSTDDSVDSEVTTTEANTEEVTENQTEDTDESETPVEESTDLSVTETEISNSDEIETNIEQNDILEPMQSDVSPSAAGNSPITVYLGDPINMYDDVLNMYVIAENEVDPSDPIVSFTYNILGTGLNGTLNNEVTTALTCIINGQAEGDLGVDNCVAIEGSRSVYNIPTGTYDIQVCAYDAAGDVGCTTDSIIVERPVGTELMTYGIPEGYPVTAFQANATAGNPYGLTLYLESRITLPGAVFDWAPMFDEYIPAGTTTLFNQDDIIAATIERVYGVSGYGYNQFDSSVLPEGHYEYRYVLVDDFNSWSRSIYSHPGYNIIDMAAIGFPMDSNSDGYSRESQYATAYYFNFQPGNVPPIIDFGSSQTIFENEDVTFPASFYDPSYRASSPFWGGANEPDDAPWTVTVDYGDGDTYVDTYNTDGILSIPNHTYSAIGTYTATLQICEASYNSAGSWNGGGLWGSIQWGDGACSTSTITVNVIKNVPEVAISANPGFSVQEGTTVTLTANVTNGDAPISYAWSGDCIGTTDEVTLPDTPGTYTCTVTVTDSDGDTDSDTVTVVVNENVPTVTIEALPSATVYEGTNVMIIAHADGEDTPLTYLWSGDPVCDGEVDTNVAIPGVTGVYTCTITVTDSDGDTATATITITVLNETPVLSVIANPGFTVNEGTDVTLIASVANSHPGDVYAWSGDCSGDTNTAVVPGITGVYTCTITVTDRDGDVESQTVTVTVNNSVPTVAITANPGTTVYTGTTVVLIANASGVNTPLTYNWRGNCAGSNTTETTVPNTPGTYTCYVDVTDADGDMATASITITVLANPVVVQPTQPIVTPVQAEEDEDTEEEDSDVLGEEDENDGDNNNDTCEVDATINGYVYYDKNGNGKKDDDENGVKDVKVTIYYLDDDGKRVVVDEVNTDTDGYWETEVCHGNYWVEVDTSTLPDNVDVDGDSKVEVKVSKDDEKNITFEVKDSDNKSWFNAWYCLIPLLLLVAAGIGYVVLTNSKKEDK
ncbi:hypothetical protein JW887_01690 [Candidatus Dojkabacteria bacterium]|nr:hypothetical protein [Candidatus Dojkabacteria bacterium]